MPKQKTQTTLWYLLIGLMLINAANRQSHAIEVFVSPQGNDKWSGKLPQANDQQSDGPVATLIRARELVRAAKRQAEKAGTPPETTYVTLRGGIYRLTESFALAGVDSGTEQAPLVFRAFANEQPIITSAVPVDQFQPDTAGIIKAVLPESLNAEQIRLVLYQGKRLPLARYPNVDAAQPISGGWAYVSGTPTKRPADKIAGETQENQSLLKIGPGNIRKWSDPTQGELFIFTRFNFWNDIVPIQSFNKTTGELRTATPCSYAIRPGDRYFIRGLREELDAPGEWFVDRSARSILVFTGPKQPKISLDIAALPNLITLRQGTTDVQFQKLVFECCTQTAVHFLECQRCALSGCTVRQIADEGGSAVYVQAGSQNSIVGCDVYDCGANGIQVSGGDSKTLAPAGNRIENCHVHHTGIITKRSSAIALSGVGNSVTHNSIHHCPRSGIMLHFGIGNQNNKVEFNHVYQVCLETQDTGGIYASGRDWVSGRGHAVRFNYVHDAKGFGRDEGEWKSPFYAIGIYLDDACSGVELTGNIIARCSRAAILVHSGRNNRIENNVIVEGGQQQIELRGWKADQTSWQAALPTMKQRYAEVSSEAAWKEMPGFVDPAQAPTASGLIMVDNTVQRNIIFYQTRGAILWDTVNLPVDRFHSDSNLIFAKQGSPQIQMDDWSVTFKKWQASGQDKQSVIADPRFKEIAKDDFELASNSPALKLGFQPIPRDKIGPYADPSRASWPLVE